MWAIVVVLVLFVLGWFGWALVAIGTDADERALREWERRRRALGGGER